MEPYRQMRRDRIRDHEPYPMHDLVERLARYRREWLEASSFGITDYEGVWGLIRIMPEEWRPWVQALSTTYTFRHWRTGEPVSHFLSFFGEVIHRASVEGYPPSGPYHVVTDFPTLPDPGLPTPPGCPAHQPDPYSPVTSPTGHQTPLPEFDLPPPPPSFAAGPSVPAQDYSESSHDTTHIGGGWLAPEVPSDAYMAGGETEEESGDSEESPEEEEPSQDMEEDADDGTDAEDAEDDEDLEDSEDAGEDSDEVVEVYAISDDISVVELSDDTTVGGGAGEDSEETDPEEVTSPPSV